MDDRNQNGAEHYGTDEDLIGVLTAISVTSKHLARELVNAYAEETAKGDNNEKHHKNGRSHRKTEKRSRRN